MLFEGSSRSAECYTDFSLVTGKMSLLPRRVDHSRQKSQPRINIASNAKPELRKCFTKAIDKATEDCPTDSAFTWWDHIRGAVFQTALDTFVRREKSEKTGLRQVPLSLSTSLPPSEQPIYLVGTQHSYPKILYLHSHYYFAYLCNSIHSIHCYFLSYSPSTYPLFVYLHHYQPTRSPLLWRSL